MFNPKTLILTSTYPTDLSPPNTNPHHRLRRRFTTILHITSLFASLIALSLFSAAIPRWNSNFFHNAGPNRGDWTDGMPIGPLAFAFLYHAAALIYTRSPKSRGSGSNASVSSLSSLSRRSLLIHTTIPVLVLLSLLPALLLAGYGSLFRFWQPAKRTQSGILQCSMLNVFTRECSPVFYDIGALQIAGIVFGTIVWSVQFTLLLVALRNLRRYLLVKQLQREKLAQYGGHEYPERTDSHRNRRRHGSGSKVGSREHASWHQHPQRLAGLPSPRSGSGSRSGSRSGSLADSVNEGQPSKTEPPHTQQQDVPVYFVQTPEASHPPPSRRYG
ncbi:uncharacterized protein Z518_07555 [Rhinocladiella mackenziei CBS 650.93]|uniref:Uncharacterized protein n=1 Tax=Rhinocladiella mackenziei CBS 650.93 TaxID=1442369 RepID=A0A0D2FPE3_9EURO|nr:uncharacterized protein Z518_07555 [Rhinocladiella mackenziei CBS 650.93]KIX04002.1 hypothetical protein Z518_07555 [Rhinocladiella mackenziei CBS 650.93]